MTPVADPFMADARPTGLQKGRGGFLRSTDDAPWVTSPNGDLVKAGARKGMTIRVKYGSPSNRGREIENDAGLVKYRQRLSFLGIGMDTALAEQCRDLVIMDADSEEFRHAADKIAVEADRLTRSWLAADRGTHGHLLCEKADKGEDWVSVANEGIALGLSAGDQVAVVARWLEMLAANGLEILAIEASCVDDRWRLAGTLDRIVRTTRPLTFVKPSGELVVIPANTVLIGDLKFGKVRPAHAIQCASYDQSVPYDTETETRGEWGFELSHKHALIFHGSFDPPSFEPVWVDLVAGREHGGETVVQAKAWAARDDVFSVAQVVTPRDNTVAAIYGTTPEEAENAVAFDADGKSHAGRLLLASAVLPVPDDEIENFLDEVRERTTPPTPDRLALVDARQSLCATPDEGGDWSTDEFAPLWDHLKALFDELPPPIRRWRWDLVEAARWRHVDFMVQTTKTERRYYINKAVIALALAGETDDDILRELLAHLVGDVALFVGVEVGHVLGSLSATEAERFAAHVDAYLSPPPAA